MHSYGKRDIIKKKAETMKMKLENSEKEYIDINIEEIRTIVTYGSEQEFVF